MRVAGYLLSVIFLGAMLGSADAAPATIEGSWSGSGIAKLRNRTDRIVCRVSFARIEGKSFRVSALCSTGGRRFEESGRVTSVGELDTDIYKQIEVDPFVDFSSLDSVLVLVAKPKNERKR